MRPGELLKDRYVVQRTLGEGGFAVTYLAHDRLTGKPCVVKALGIKGVDKFKTIELFEREARVLRGLDHPRIPDFLDFFTVEDPGHVAIYLVQELIAGKNLAELVAEGRRFSAAEIIAIAVGVAEILAYLHGQNPPIYHRDIKPSNIMLTPANEVYLIDFGAVRAHLLSEDKVMGASSVVGTFGYMPLEQFEGRVVAGSDIYSLGATLIFLASHREPWTLEKKAGLRLDFEDATNLPPPVSRVIGKMVEPDYRERYPTLAELLKALRRLRALAERGFPPATRWRALAAMVAGLALAGTLALVWWPRSAQIPIPPEPREPLVEPVPPKVASLGQVRACQPETLAPGNVVSMPYSAPLDDGLPAGAIRRYGTTRLRHATSCMAVAISPDGKLLASADQEISLWDTSSGRELRRLVGHCNWVSALRFAADGRELVSASLDRSVRRWEVATGRVLAAREFFAGVSAMAQSADGRSLVLGGQDLRVTLLDGSLAAGFRVFEDMAAQGHGQNPHTRIENVAMSPDGSLVAATDGRGAMVWKTMNGKRADFGPLLSQGSREAEWVEFADNRHLLVASSGKVRVWDLDARAYTREIGLEYVSGGLKMALSPGRDMLAVSGTESSIQLIDLRKGQRLPSLSASEWYVGPVAFSADGRRLASAGWDGKARLWDWRQRHELLPDAGPVNAVYEVGFSPDGKTLHATHAWSQQRQRWNVASGKHLGAERGALEELRFARIGPDISGGWSVLVTAEERALLRAFIDRVAFRLGFTNVARGKDGALLLVSAEDASVRFFDVRSGKELLAVTLPAEAVAHATGKPAPAAAPVVAAPSSAIVRVWFEQPGTAHEELATFQPRGGMITAIAFSADGKLLALVDDRGSLTTWDVKARKLLSGWHAGWVHGLAFLPNAKYLVLHTGTVEVRDARDGKEVGRVGDGHRGPVSAFALSSDGKTIATGGLDTTLLLWPAPVSAR